MSIDLSIMNNNRERAMALINEGGATKQSLMEALEISDKSLASLFAQLRLMGHYPIKAEDGTFSLGTFEEYQASKPAPKEKKETTPKTKEELIEAATKRETKAAAALDNANVRYEKDPSRKNELKKIIAQAELELASILVGEVSNMPEEGFVEEAPAE